MATVNFLRPATGNTPDNWTGTISRTSPSEIIISNGANSATYKGSIQYNAEGAPLSGNIDSYDKFVGGELAFRVTNTSVNVSTVDNFFNSGNIGELDAYGLAGADTITGSAGKDFIRGYDGDDAINGGAGVDTAVFSGNMRDYTIMAITDGPTITGYSVHSSANNEGTDTLVNVERLRFADATVAIDIGGNGGMAYRLYQAALDRTPDAAGLGAHIDALDKGASIFDIAQNFINSAEFSSIYGNLDNTQFVTKLYENALNRAPDAEGLAFHVRNLESGALTRAQTLYGFSESAENQAALIGVIQDGFVFIPMA